MFDQFRNQLENLLAFLGTDDGPAPKRSAPRPPAPPRFRADPLEDRLALATFTVTNTLDALVAPAGSLRAAINQANDEVTNPGADSVVFAAGVAGKITLADTLTISAPLTLTGPGQAALTVSGNNLVRVFDVAASASGPGGNQQTFFRDLTIADGRADGSADSTGGGGVRAAGLTQYLNVTFSGNKAVLTGGGTASGGAVYLSDDGVFNTVTFTGNSAVNDGGAVFVTATKFGFTSATIFDGALDGNTADRGGALAAVIDPLLNGSANVSLTRMAVINNAARQGGGAYFDTANGALTVQATTVAANKATETGGGLSTNGGAVQLTNVTIARNTAANQSGGVENPDPDPTSTNFQAFNSIIALNTAPTHPDLTGPVFSVDGDVFGDTTGATVILPNGVMAPNFKTGDPLLGPLQVNTKGTPTLLPLAGSPALNFGKGFSSSTPPGGGGGGFYQAAFSDQRGFTRSFATATVDAGATYVQPPTAVGDLYVTSIGKGLTVAAPGVLGNDTPGDGTALTASLVTAPSKAAGTLVINPDGSFAFTPAAGFTGPAEFTYQVSNGVKTATGGGRIMVTGANPGFDLAPGEVLAALDLPNTTNPYGGNFPGLAQVDPAAAPTVAPATATINLPANGGQVVLNGEVYFVNSQPGNSNNPYDANSGVGSDDSSTLFRFNVQTGVVSPVATFGRESAGLIVAADGSLVNLFYDGVYSKTNPYGPDSATIGLSRIDPATGASTVFYSEAVPNLPATQALRYNNPSRFFPNGVAQSGGDFYFGLTHPGSNRDPNNPYAALDDATQIRRFDPDTNTATTLATLARASTGLAAAADGSLLNTYFDGQYSTANPYGPDSATIGLSRINPTTGAETPLYSEPVPGQPTFGGLTVASSPTTRGVTELVDGRIVFGVAGIGSAQFRVYAPATNTQSVLNGINGASLYGLTTIPANRPPVVVNTTFPATSGQTLVVPAPGVLAGATDPNGDPLTAQLVTGPAANQGTLVLNPNGGFTFTPAAGFTGTATFTYRASDGRGGLSAPATASITVTASNAAPTVQNATFTVVAGQPLAVPAPGVLAGATDPNGDPLTAQLVAGPPAEQGTLVLGSDGSFLFTPTTGFSGTVTFTYQASDGRGGVSAVGTATVTVTPVVPPVPPVVEHLFAVGAGAGGGPRVTAYTSSGQVRFDVFAFEPTFTGGVRVAVGDVTGDGVDDVAVGAGVGGGPRVVVLDGRDGSFVVDYFAYETSFTGGVFLAVADLDGDGKAEVVTGTGSTGGPRVRAFDRSGAVVRDFMAFEASFTGGVRVAAGDLDGDGRAEIITTPGLSGGPRVVVFSGTGGEEIASFFAFNPDYRGGTFVTLAGGPGNVRIVASADSSPGFAGSILERDVAAGGATDVGAVVTATPAVFSFTLDPVTRAVTQTGPPLTPFEPSFLGGVRVAGLDDGLLAAAGSGGGRRIQVFALGQNGFDPTPVAEFPGIAAPNFDGSIYVGGGRGPVASLVDDPMDLTPDEEEGDLETDEAPGVIETGA